MVNDYVVSGADFAEEQIDGLIIINILSVTNIVICFFYYLLTNFIICRKTNMDGL